MGKTKVVDPNDVRFTQDYVSPAFQSPYQGVFLKDAIAQIKRKDMTVSEFPKPVVIKHENTLWCLDNRRLYIFRKAKVDKIDVQISESRTHPRLSVVLEDPKKKEKMMKKEFFPYVLPYEPGKGVHTEPPPAGYPPIPLRQPGYCPPTRSIPHPGPNSNAVVEQPCQYHPYSNSMQIPDEYMVMYSMQVGWPRAHYSGPEARCTLPNVTNYNWQQGLSEPRSIAAAKVREDHVVQMGPARNLEVGVWAPPPAPPIVISPRPRSTSKCSRSQVRSGPIVSAYKKVERLAAPLTRAFMKPNAFRDPKPVCSGQDLKGKVAVVVEKEASRLPSAAGATLSSKCPPSASNRVPDLETGFCRVKLDSISLPGVGSLKAPPKQPEQATKVKDPSMVLLDWRRPINLPSITNEELPDKRMNARIVASDHKPVEMSRLPSKNPSAAGATLSSKCPPSASNRVPDLETGFKLDSISPGVGNPKAPPKQPEQATIVKDPSMILLDWPPINLGTILKEELQDKRMCARISPTDHKPVEMSGTVITRNDGVVDIPPPSERDAFLPHVPVANIPKIRSPLLAPLWYMWDCCGFSSIS